MRVEILHNVTTDTDGRHAPFTRIGADLKTMPGDQLVRVGELYAANATEPSHAAQFAFDAGNNPDESKPAVIQYRAWQVRSLSVGDVVAVHRTVGDIIVLSCESNGWRIVDLSDFDVTRPALTHAQGNAMLDAIVAEFAIQDVAHELRRFAGRHLSQTRADLEEIGTSDISIHLARLANYHTHLVREEAERLHHRQELVRKVAASTGQPEADTLRDLRLLFQPADEQ